jgi:PIN domain nuclease of toxin-antitoxin system
MSNGESILLDTHIWLDLAAGRLHVPGRVLRRFEKAAAAGLLYVAAITPWEVAMLLQRGKIRVSSPVLEFITGCLRETQTAVAPFEPAVAVDAVELPAWDHRDPADRMIVATGRSLGAVLVTRDAAILEYAARAKAVRVLDAG